MNKFALYLSFLGLVFAHTAAQEIPPPYIASDYILLNCGSSTNSTSLDGRIWEGDSHSKFSPHNIQSTAYASTPTSEQNTFIAQVPYITARIFPNNFTYSFLVSSGLHFLRLYFYPATYRYAAVDKSKSFFSVTANEFTLLRNFSAFLTVLELEPPAAFFVKEFIIPVSRTHFLNITFTSLNSYAFVNGIEVVSIPDNLYMDNTYDAGIKFVDYNTLFYFDGTTALETMYRLNVGGKDISGVEDTGMFRTWVDDSRYVIGHSGLILNTPDVTIQYTTETPAYTAPEIVYETSRSMGKNGTANLSRNLTWNFKVDAGFYYLFRLHFCETLFEVEVKNDRAFKIFINNQTAEKDADVLVWSVSPGIPVYRDYIVLAPHGTQRKLDLLLALNPAVEIGIKPRFNDALLNGVEIYKLNRSDGSFAGLNQDGVAVPTSPEGNKRLAEKTKRSPRIVAVIISIAISAIILGFLIFHMSKRAKKLGSRNVGDSKCSPLPSHLCRHFSFAEIKAATKNFDDGLVIGFGGFGNVYKGYFEDRSTPIAIKRLKSGSQQGAQEFTTEISTLSKLRHCHIVSLIGYCDEDREMILVYEYMNCGTLHDHLYGTHNPPLTWNRRLDICIGAALGLEYLHTGVNHPIIHRDVKTTNILLNEKWVAKVSDFGLAKFGPTSASITHVSTAVKGSFGYLDPEYFRHQQLTEKSDIYSFGIVLCEVLCARPALARTAVKKQVNLAEWFRECYHEDMLDEIVDPFLNNMIKPECLKKFGEVAVSCLLHDRSERPSMKDVVGGLQFALQLQGSSSKER